MARCGPFVRPSKDCTIDRFMILHIFCIFLPLLLIKLCY